ncbi:MAG: endopeptidase La [Abditibacteriota bacterium]|nr:endopeptidase La [Abditibacteriota bacterium]
MKPDIENGVPILFAKDGIAPLFQSDENIPDLEERTISILPLKDSVLLPKLVMPLIITRKQSMQLIDDAVLKEQKYISLHGMKRQTRANPRTEDLYDVGVVASIHSMLKINEEQRVLVQGLKRVKITEIISEKPYITARVTELPDIEDWMPGEDVQVEALRRSLASAWQKLCELSPVIPDDLASISTIGDPGLLTNNIAMNMPVDTQQKQDWLETVGIRKRMRKLYLAINRETEILELSVKIQNSVTKEINQHQKEFFLREQIRMIHKELGDSEDPVEENEELRNRILEAHMPDEAEKQALREADRLGHINPSSPEYTVAHTYLDWMLSLPWNTYTNDILDLDKVQKVLDQDHYGLEKVKDRIVEYLAVKKFRNDEKARHPILCLVGPPGVGKTSLGKSVARAMNRKFVRISLGGVRDEAEIRGHRRTYIGALPGQVIQGLKRAESHNPVFMLDEIDKLASDYRGDPASALLEVLDPEQNDSFRDHYLEVPFDLSKVFFITTANRLDTINTPLRDRMEILELPGYTEEEKFHIAKKHLVPKQMKEHGLTKAHIVFLKDGITELIRGYTMEAGVRTLERKIAAVCRKCARYWADNGAGAPVRINKNKVNEYLGAPRYAAEEIDSRVSEPGVMVGMAWTSFGGDILYIEATRMQGKGNLQITGQLGDVMKESAQLAYTYVRAHAEELGIDPAFYEKTDIHIHVPAGAIPKDGPSAGVTLVSAMVSLLTGKKAVYRLAMTGEITLRGKVLPIGGVKEKLLAAKRAGIDQVIVPKANEKDVKEDVPEAILSELKVNYVENIGQVLELAIQK